MREDLHVLDMNVSLGHWPFEPMNPSKPSQLSKHLRSHGVRWAIVSSLDAVLYRDPQWGNDVLYRSIARIEGLFPCGVINPTLPNWKSTLELGIQAGCIMVKLFPNYHQYDLSHRSVDELMLMCEGQGILVALSVRMEDERAHPGIMRVPAVSLEEIETLAQRWLQCPILLLCPTLGEVQRLDSTDNLIFEISHVEHFHSLPTLWNVVPSDRTVFGSHTPFLYTGAAIAKLEDPEISESDRNKVAFEVAYGLRDRAEHDMLGNLDKEVDKHAGKSYPESILRSNRREAVWQRGEDLQVREDQTGQRRGHGGSSRGGTHRHGGGGTG